MSMRPHALVLLVSLAACTNGQLNQSTFNYDCEAQAGRCRVQPLVDPVATGAALSLLVQLRQSRGETLPPTQLRSADPDILRTDGPLIVGAKPGVTTLMLTTPDGVVMDFYHVWVGDPSHIRAMLVAADGTELGALTGANTMHVGDAVDVRVRPFTQAQPMLGVFDVAWSGGGSVVTITQGTADGTWRLRADAPGTAHITAAALGLTTTFDVEVLP